MDVQQILTNRSLPNARGCRVWLGRFDKDGYGKVWYKKKSWRVPRVIYELTRGTVPKNKWVLHTCDNPPCSEETHLFLGTNIDNVNDRETKGRGNHTNFGSQNGQAKLDAQRVVQIRLDYMTGELTTRQLAKRHGVSQSTLWDVVANISWKHVACPIK